MAVRLGSQGRDSGYCEQKFSIEFLKENAYV